MSERETGFGVCRRWISDRRAEGNENMRVEVGRDYLLFDGDCGVCSWSADVARRMDRDHNFIIEPYQVFDESELMRFGIDYEKCSRDRKSTRLNSSHVRISYAVFC